jgi:hypothetical protein
MPVIVMLTAFESFKWGDGSADSIAIGDDEANLESLRTSAEMICDVNLNIMGSMEIILVFSLVIVNVISAEGMQRQELHCTHKRCRKRAVE